MFVFPCQYCCVHIAMSRGSAYARSENIVRTRSQVLPSTNHSDTDPHMNFIMGTIQGLG